MLRRVLAGLCVGFMCIFAAGCGQTYKLQSISVTDADSLNLTTLGEADPLTVTANFSNTKTSVVTTTASYNGVTAPNAANAPAAPNGAVTVDDSGIVHLVGQACTWAIPVGGTNAVDYPYIVNVSYSNNGVTKTAQVPISVAITGSGCNGQ